MSIIVRVRILLAVVSLCCGFQAHGGNLLYADHPLAGKIWDLSRRSYLDEAALLENIETADVLLIGEVHDNPQHHDIERRLLKARIKSAPALMMEQLNADDQAALDLSLSSSDRDDVLRRVYRLIRFSNAQDYQPLLAIAVNNNLPIIAANVTNQHLLPVIWRGFEAYDAGELKRLAVEQVWNEERQRYLLANMGGAHCGQLKDELRAGLTRSQRMRDALMADSAVASIARGVIAIVGSSHARRDIGLPLYLAARAPTARIVSIGMVEVSPSRNDPIAYVSTATGEAPYDVIWFTPRVERADPCADLVMPKMAEPPAGKPKAKPARSRDY